MLPNTTQKHKSLNARILVSFAVFAAVLFFLTSLLTAHSSVIKHTQSAQIKAQTGEDADQQLSTDHTFSDPLNDATDSYTNKTNSEKTFPFAHQIRRVSIELKIDESLVYAVTKAESSFRSGVQSNAGAIGLMQVIATAAGRDAYYRLHKKSVFHRRGVVATFTWH